MPRDNLAGLIGPMFCSAGGFVLSRCALCRKQSSDDRPPCLENPRPAGAESTLAENAASPFQAEPAQIWFDGNRPAALRAFTKRGTVPEILFYRQVYKIEATKIIDTIKPAVIDSFDAQGEFKFPAALLEEMRMQ